MIRTATQDRHNQCMFGTGSYAPPPKVQAISPSTDILLLVAWNLRSRQRLQSYRRATGRRGHNGVAMQDKRSSYGAAPTGRIALAEGRFRVCLRSA